MVKLKTSCLDLYFLEQDDLKQRCSTYKLKRKLCCNSQFSIVTFCFLLFVGAQVLTVSAGVIQAIFFPVADPQTCLWPFPAVLCWG